jgi:soluble lytic murein transglycosylase-like protein
LSVNMEIGHNCLSPKQAASSSLWRTAAILLALCSIAAMPSRAQVASYVDATGKRVFINANPPAPKKPVATTNAAQPTPAPVKEAPPASATAAPKVRDAQVAPKPALDRMVNDVAERHQMDPNLIRAVVQAESNWNPLAISRKGAYGLMQLIPGTAAKLGVTNVFDPEQNLDGGTRYLRMLLERYNGDVPKALAAYNAGAGNVDRFNGIPNFRETRQYVQKVTNFYNQPGSTGNGFAGFNPHRIRQTVDEHGRVVFTNE